MSGEKCSFFLFHFRNVSLKTFFWNIYQCHFSLFTHCFCICHFSVQVSLCFCAREVSRFCLTVFEQELKIKHFVNYLRFLQSRHGKRRLSRDNFVTTSTKLDQLELMDMLLMKQPFLQCNPHYI